MRTQQEILKRTREAAKDDMLGFEWQEYLRAMTAKTAKELRGTLLKKGADLSEWKPDLMSDGAIQKQCIGYMLFAWDKANGCRGISAERSLAHYKAWMWLLGEDGWDNIDEYEHYGKDNLVRICKFFDLDASQWDDGRRVNSELE